MTSALVAIAKRAPAQAAYPVLVIDDHKLFSTSLTMALRSEGFDARTPNVARARAAGPPVMSVAEHRGWLEQHRRYLAQERELSRRLSRLSRASGRKT